MVDFVVLEIPETEFSGILESLVVGGVRLLFHAMASEFYLLCFLLVDGRFVVFPDLLGVSFELISGLLSFGELFFVS